MENTAILLMHCSDKTGIIAAVTDFLQKNNGNIVNLDEHVDAESKQFFMRIEWELENFGIKKDKIGEYFDTLIAKKFDLQFELRFTGQKMRMAVFVTKLSHCLYDILYRHQSGEWNVEIPLIISNHESLRPIVERFDIPFHVIPKNKTNKAEQEAKEIALLKEHNIDLIVLARYMQIISDDFVRQYPNQIINIHHSFLPAFIGARPYHAAYRRGVKIIGATSHYVTAELDAGPIIAQDIEHISHRDSIKDLIRKGKDVEKLVLSKAIYNHIQHKILSYNNRTVLFN